METIQAYIMRKYPPDSVFAGQLQYARVSCYYYNIQNVGVILYDNPYQQGTYCTAEYYTGRLIAHAPTMQEALDKAVGKIDKLGPENVRSKIAGHLADTGYANKPVCSWCGKQHEGGPENCKE